jgi:signal transduction histidine kinase/CheY-like chemotaxis protein
MLAVRHPNESARAPTTAPAEPITDDPFQSVSHLFQLALATGAPATLDGQPAGAPGSLPYTSFVALPVTIAGSVVGLVGAADRPGGYDPDIGTALQPFLATCGLLIQAFRANATRQAAEDDRRHMEAQVQHAQKLESLGVLAGGIAHDFNNLLVGVLGHAELARFDVAPDSPLAERLRHIETAALRASELTNQMLAYSGKGAFQVSSVDLTHLVREMAQLLDVSISKKALLRYQFAPGTPPVDADQAQIRQVVMNLLTNASEAIGDREGTITIRIGTVEVDAPGVGSGVGAVPEPGRYVFFEVEDTGIGMDAETAARIFDPFFTTKFTGRGLGLAATLGIVRGHGGGVRIRSTPGKGSAFTVLLPPGRMTPARSDSRETAPSIAALGGVVLVVDDEPTVRAVAKASLERAGFGVLTATDGRDALSIIRANEEPIDAVVVDLTMPFMSGDEVIAQIHHLRPDLGILLSSGYAEPEIARTLAAHYNCGFIQKPYRALALIEAVRTLIHRRAMTVERLTSDES